MSRSTFRNILFALSAVAVTLSGVLGAAAPASAQRAGSLEGSWSGGGRVVLPSGNTERARCRATFRRQPGSNIGMSATCATPSARIVQVASLQRVGANSYAGRFRNAEYDIDGSIRISVRGNRLTASLAGGGGSALFTLAR